MTLTMQILKILAKSKEPMSARAFMEMTGEPVARIERTIRDCIRQRWIVLRAGFYEITLEGAVRAKWVPKTSPKKLEQKARAYAEKRAARIVTVDLMASQPALAMAWR